MIKVLLWDVDATLLNFKKSEKYALQKCFDIFNLGICDNEMIKRYSKINHGYWQKLERNEISKNEVLINRFVDFFQSENINFNKHTEFNQEYQIRLGDKIFFNDDAYKLLNKLNKDYIQYAVTNGTATAQKAKLANSGLDQIFNDVFISDELGIEKPNKGFFDLVFKQIGDYKCDEVMIIGDSLTSDIQGGNNAGILCCWYNPDKLVNNKNLKIDYEIDNLDKLYNILGVNHENS